METSEYVSILNDIVVARRLVDITVNEKKQAVFAYASEIVRYANELSDAVNKGDADKASAYLLHIAQQIQQGVRVASQFEGLVGVQHELDKHFGFSDI